MKEEWKRTNDAAPADSSQEDLKLKPFHIWIWMEVFSGKDGIQSAELERTKRRQRPLRILRWRSGVKTLVLQFHPKSLRGRS